MERALLIPGTLCDHRLFAPMLNALDLDATVAPPIDHASVEEAAEAVLPLLGDETVVIGFSLGGFVALELLRRAPERIAGLVLIASNAQALQQGNAESRRADLNFAREMGLAALIERLWPLYVPGIARENGQLRRLIIDMAETTGIDRFAQQTELAINRPDSQATLRATSMPVLLISGTEDEMTSAERYRLTAKARGTGWVELIGVGHFAPLEAPEACAAAITTWLSEARACCSA